MVYVSMNWSLRFYIPRYIKSDTTSDMVLCFNELVIAILYTAVYKI